MPEPKISTPCYMGRKPCGCLVAVCVNTRMHMDETAKDLADWVRHGLTIEHSTVETFKGMPFGCKCEGSAKGKGEEHIP